jgi:archaellum component FlaC
LSITESATDDDINRIRDLLTTIKQFLSRFVKETLDYAVLDVFADLVDDIKAELPRIEDAIGTVMSHLNDLATEEKGLLYRLGLTGSQLRLKFETIKRSISLVNKYSIIKAVKKVRKWVAAAFKAINDSLGSLKEAFSAAPGISAALDLIEEFKGHLENVTTVVTED